MSQTAAPPTSYDKFYQYVLTNIQYWQDYLVTQALDIEALDYGRNRIIKAISMAFKFEAAWPLVYPLIESFSPYMERRGFWGVWQGVLSEAIEIARRSEDIVAVVGLSALLARLLQQQSRFKEAITFHRQTIRMAHRIEDNFNKARACSNLGFLYAEQGYGWRAEVLCCHALKIFERLNSQHGLAHTHNHLGHLHRQLGRWISSQQHFERACDLWQTMEDSHGLMRGFHNLGALYNELERPTEALGYLEKALPLAKLNGDEADTARIYLNLGVAHRLKGASIQAEKYARKAETIFRRVSSTIGLAEVWGNLGLVCLDQGKSEAAVYLHDSLNAWRTLKNRRGEIKTLLYIAANEASQENQSAATQRFNEIESLLHQFDSTGTDLNLQTLFLKYRRNFGEG